MDIISIQEFLDFHGDKIEREKCVLFLGPRFGVTDTGENIHDKVLQRLLEYYNAKTPPFNAYERLDIQDNLVILRKKKGEEDPKEPFELRARLSEYYLDLTPHPLYAQIARLPINAIISCSPDLLLRNAFRQLNIDHDFFYYSPSRQIDRPKERSGVPILYNLFGSAEDRGSFLITYEYFFRFVFAMLGDNSDEIPQTLKNVLKEAHLFMLLGFDLEKWYVPLLLRRLSLNEEKSKDQEKISVVGEKIKTTPDDEQKLSTPIFILEEQATSQEIIATLTEKLKDKLRLGVKVPVSVAAAPVHVLVSEDKLNEALDLLQNLFEQRALNIDDLVATQGRLTALVNAFQAGIIPPDNFEAQKNLIRQHIIALAKTLDKTD